VKRDPVVILVVAMVASLMLVFGLHMARRNSGQNGPPGGNLAGQTAPDFTLTALDGSPVRLSNFRGKAVLLNFWATWCEPCKIEMPWFIDMQKQYGPDGLQVVGVAMDDASQEDISKFARNMGVNYPIVIGKEGIGSAYGGVQFLPETFYIGRDGKVVSSAFGLKGRGEIEESIKKALASSQSVQAENK
jgi:peroxiredoxin